MEKLDTIRVYFRSRSQVWSSAVNCSRVQCTAAAACGILVETTAGQGTCLGASFAEIGAILSSLFFWRVALPLIVVHGAYQALQGLWLAPWLADIGGQSRPEVARSLMAGSLAYGLGSVIFGTLADRMAARLCGVSDRWMEKFQF